ncbi:Ribosomal RNA large subunit methyltransferase H [Lactobacillus helveticus]|nr:Ribosomal RNA large subunit methyltransferase H [Lactobacillus helveticus]NRN94334.1 Ribosomal RNA large subunit methyltransferase H [Lactobacillus helveticus]NRO54758.1 Ribosomal RNA large subunit methyltransferase H [Lactobacillus helveticus]
MEKFFGKNSIKFEPQSVEVVFNNTTKCRLCFEQDVENYSGISVNFDDKLIGMNIKIVCVGKLKEKYFKDAIAEYKKRLSRFAKVSIVQVPDENAPEKFSAAEDERVKQIEGERILSKIKDKEYVYVTAIKGKQRSSEKFAKEIQDLATYGHSDITFVIGGSLGTSDAVNKRGDDLISFGKLTMPHQLMRVVLIEQIYRAFMINSGSPYHK